MGPRPWFVLATIAVSCTLRLGPEAPSANATSSSGDAIHPSPRQMENNARGRSHSPRTAWLANGTGFRSGRNFRELGRRSPMLVLLTQRLAGRRIDQLRHPARHAGYRPICETGQGLFAAATSGYRPPKLRNGAKGMTLLKNARCAECGTQLIKDAPCPNCGSIVRCFFVNPKARTQVSAPKQLERPGLAQWLVKQFARIAHRP